MLYPGSVVPLAMFLRHLEIIFLPCLQNMPFLIYEKNCISCFSPSKMCTSLVMTPLLNATFLELLTRFLLLTAWWLCSSFEGYFGGRQSADFISCWRSDNNPTLTRVKYYLLPFLPRLHKVWLGNWNAGQNYFFLIPHQGNQNLPWLLNRWEILGNRV